MLLDTDTLAIGLSLVFILTIGVVVVVIVLTRAGRTPPGGFAWDEMKHVPGERLQGTPHMQSPSGVWPPPSVGLDPADGAREPAQGNDGTSSPNVSTLIPL